MNLDEIAELESKAKTARGLAERIRTLEKLIASERLDVHLGSMRQVDVYDAGVFALTLQPGLAANQMRDALRAALQTHIDQLAAALAAL